jgi:hypothetical protein
MIGGGPDTDSGDYKGCKKEPPDGRGLAPVVCQFDRGVGS